MSSMRTAHLKLPLMKSPTKSSASGSSMGENQFKFVASSNSNLHNGEFDEDWGDFVDNFSKKQDFYHSSVHNFSPSNGFFDSRNPSETPEPSRNFDPFVVLSDQSMEPPESQSGRVELELASSGSAPVEKRWEKPKGALPLSIFGDVEEEPDLNPALDDAQNLFYEKTPSSVKNGLNFGSGIGLSDLVVNLYAQSEQIKAENENALNSDPVNESGDFDEDDWEFKDAFTENGTTNSESGAKKDQDVPEIPVEAAAAPTATTTTAKTSDGVVEVNGEMWGGFEGSTIVSGFHNTEQLGGDWFEASNGYSHNPDKVFNDFSFEFGGTTTNGSTSDLISQFDLISMENGSNSYLNDGVYASEEHDTTLDLIGQPKETPKLADQSDVETKDLMFDDKSHKTQGNGRGSEHHQGALALSIFSHNKQDSDESLFGEDAFSYQPPNSARNGTNSQNLSLNVSFNDLISNLYSQAEHVPAITATQESNENGLTQMGSDFDTVNGDADFDDNPWEFKDAFSETRAENQSSVLALGDALQKFSPESGSMNFVDFYSKLKDELYFIACYHLDDLKKAQETAALSSNDAKAAALQDEIQAAYKKLDIDNVVSKEVCLKDHPTPNISVTKLLEVVKEPKYQVLESEYLLSKRISMAEKDLTSAVGSFEHAVSMVKILTLGSMEDQFNYTTTWSKMISACAQELKHGALIWKQSLEKNLHREILSKSKGQQYIVALGEIYRVVEVLRASATFYKPWIFSSLADPMGIFTCLEECDAAWSGSVLEEALNSISYPLSIEYEETTNALLESIKSIHVLNSTAPQNHVDSMEEPICRLSLLSQRLLPDMKMVAWDGEQYFLTLANLWANCVSRELPELAHIQLGS